MTSADFEYPDEAGYPDGVGTLTEDQVVLIDEVNDDHSPTITFFVARNEPAATYEAISGDTVIGGLTFEAADENRLVLVAAAVYPEYRGQGVATELIRRVLDDVRDRGVTVTILCPIVRAFIDRNPAYDDLVDRDLPGLRSSR
ncbi:GNAT family N-acetyltransferase [Leifsonia sp. F6_8S_P_1B]|uniref:GNAT family N-acetyltransferase n=1 Tax=Leifsonia williamsii TaxID=3035919 RepID=A0ABT8K9I1_9MICO|nr:GNAT family N-acetyltransferase [Leifsonia williamsii]MDN4614103.1 GNAT family N-acetyltransferase [Leifsonia williamsii]